jgi:hypothetical protein
MARRTAILLSLAIALASCGSEASRRAAPQAPTVATLEEQEDCEPAGQRGDETLFLCWRGDSRYHGRFVFVAGDTERPVEVPSPGGIGHWAWAELSPDGETILAQWSAECEVPIAYFIPAAGGRPREAVEAYSSRAVGWADEGRAIVKLLESACGASAPKPGFYLVDPDGMTSGPFKRAPD